MNLDFTLPVTSRIYLLSFVISAFQSLESDQIRKECAPLVSIPIWHNLFSSDARNSLLEKSPGLKKGWRIATKRYDAADETGKARLRFERSWLYSMMLNFLQCINTGQPGNLEVVRYCERFMELLVDLESQLPTRRYVNTLLKDLNILPVIRISKMFAHEENLLFRDFYFLLRHFIHIPIDDHSGQPRNAQEVYDIHYQELAQLQRVAIKHFQEKLTLLALSNYGSLEQRTELESNLSALDDTEMGQLCSLLGFRTVYPAESGVVPDRRLLMEILLSAFEKRPLLQDAVSELNILPTEKSLYDPALVRNEAYDGSRPLAIPKLNLQYLSSGDFLWRSLILYRSEAFFEIKNDLELVVRRMQPRVTGEKHVAFEGFSRMAMPVAKPAIIDVAPPKVGSVTPAYVRAEVALETSRLTDNVRREWEELRPQDVVFLLAIRPSNKPAKTLTGGRERNSNADVNISLVRAAEVVQVLEENGRPLRAFTSGQANGSYQNRPRLRRLLLNIDVKAYNSDIAKTGVTNADIYSSINLIVRRKSRANNFKPILETIQSLTLAETSLPAWLQDVFLGYGDPSGANFKQLTSEPKSVDFRDTFLDWQHLVDSFPRRSIQSVGGEAGSLNPPYVLEIPPAARETEKRDRTRKRRHSQSEPTQPSQDPIRVSMYTLPNSGPYPVDAPKMNQVRFTPAQVEAVMSGSLPGLTVIVGPPGTGKTDVTTQIISNIYPQRTDATGCTQ
jgi:intron-binding protein aquarius